jgi:hypothetical protein
MRTSLKLKVRRALIVAGLCALSTSASAGGLLNRHLERPTAQKGVNGATSYVQRSVTLASAGLVEFDYFVDSEPAKDFLELKVDGVTRFNSSGADRGGTAKVALTAGTHVLRFAYTKDASGSAGQDTAWIEQIKVMDGSHLIDSFAFDEQPLGAVAGFQAGGTSGGMVVTPTTRRFALQRPSEGAFRGYQPTHTRSSVERTLTWPQGSTNNVLTLTYWVDSEENYDYLRVYVDGVERFAMSGHDKGGRQRINVGAAGPHRVELVYDKDESVDVGTDDARIIDLQAVSKFGSVQLGGFEAGDLGAHAEGWMTGSLATSGLTWEVGHTLPRHVFAERVSAATEPAINGVIENDYVRPSTVKLPNLNEASLRPAELLVQGLDSGKYVFALRTPKGSTATSELELAFDFQRNDTLAANGCGQLGTRPGPEDRRLHVTFSAALGNASTVVQEQGACDDAGGWNTVAPADAWTVQGQAGESDADPGYVHVEFSVAPPTSVAIPGEFGLAMRWDRDGRLLQLPRVEGEEPDFSDTATWESISYTAPTIGLDFPLVAVDGRPVSHAN